MQNLNSKLESVSDFFKNGDSALGYRRLIDCGLDTRNIDVYKKTLALIEKSENENQPNDFSEVFDFIHSLNDFRMPASQASSLPLLKVENIGKQYAKSQFKISPLSFQLNYGEIIGLVGENGNGKTTLLKLLTQDLDADEGSLTFNLKHDSVFELRSQLVYIPQRVPKWHGSLLDNLQFAMAQNGILGEDNMVWVDMVIARLGLRKFKHLNWTQISSGYRTRFEIAKSLLRKPKLMLLDEPLSNLDIISQQTILQDLKFLAQSESNPFGLILSSQQLYEVEKIADLVIFLKQGEAQFQNNNAERNEADDLIFEIETTENRETLLKVFETLDIKALNFNGGVFIAHFHHSTQSSDVFRNIGNNDLKLNAIRNISQSSRRFFIK